MSFDTTVITMSAFTLTQWHTRSRWERQLPWVILALTGRYPTSLFDSKRMRERKRLLIVIYLHNNQKYSDIAPHIGLQRSISWFYSTTHFVVECLFLSMKKLSVLIFLLKILVHWACIWPLVIWGSRPLTRPQTEKKLCQKSNSHPCWCYLILHQVSIVNKFYCLLDCHKPFTFTVCDYYYYYLTPEFLHLNRILTKLADRHLELQSEFVFHNN